MILPLLDLRTSRGDPVAWSQLWQRKNLLLLFGHDPACTFCSRVLADWSGRADELRYENTVSIAVFREDPGAAIPGQVLVIVDPGDRLANAVGAGPGKVVSTDRFFEILEEEDAHTMGADEAAFDSIDWVKLAERRCPECGVGTW